MTVVESSTVIGVVTSIAQVSALKPLLLWVLSLVLQRCMWKVHVLLNMYEDVRIMYRSTCKFNEIHANS